MTIIGVSGPIAHGKTSFCQALQRQVKPSRLYESSTVITELARLWLAESDSLPAANDLKQVNLWLKRLVPIIQREYDLVVPLRDFLITSTAVNQNPRQYEKLFDFLRSQKTVIPTLEAENKDEYRNLLQWMGGYFVATIDDGIWYKQITTAIKHDATQGLALAVVGGLRFPRDGQILKELQGVIVDLHRPGLSQLDLSDPTEASRQRIAFDTRVSNDGTLEQLEACAAALYHDVLQHSVRPHYSAASFSVSG